MISPSEIIAELWADDSGISSVEYVLLLGFVASGIILSAASLGTSVSGEMNEMALAIDAGDCDNSGGGDGTGGAGGSGQGGENTC